MPDTDEPNDALDLPIYREGNSFQRRMYEHLARYNVKRGQRSFGKSRHGNPYAHLLPADDALRNFLEDEHILAAVKRRFASHKAGVEERALTNTAASQAFCFNLFVPLAEDLRLRRAFLVSCSGGPSASNTSRSSSPQTP